MTIDEFIAVIEDQPPPATEDEVARFEGLIGQPLPADYRSFLVRCNGGRVRDGYFYQDWPFMFGINAVVGLCYESVFSFDRFLDEGQGWVPDSLLWIMNSMFGDAICLGITGEAHGRVFYLDHERLPGENWDGSLETADHIMLLTDSFTEFVAAIRLGVDLYGLDEPLSPG